MSIKKSFDIINVMYSFVAANLVRQSQRLQNRCDLTQHIVSQYIILYNKKLCVCSFWSYNQNDWRTLFAATLFFGNCISFIRFIFIINFLLSLGGRPMNAPTFKRNFYIYKNSRATMICTLQTVFPTLIFHFPFSILHLIKPSSWA